MSHAGVVRALVDAVLLSQSLCHLTSRNFEIEAHSSLPRALLLCETCVLRVSSDEEMDNGHREQN